MIGIREGGNLSYLDAISKQASLVIHKFEVTGVTGLEKLVE